MLRKRLELELFSERSTLPYVRILTALRLSRSQYNALVLDNGKKARGTDDWACDDPILRSVVLTRGRAREIPGL